MCAHVAHEISERTSEMCAHLAHETSERTPEMCAHLAHEISERTPEMCAHLCEEISSVRGDLTHMRESFPSEMERAEPWRRAMTLDRCSPERLVFGPNSTSERIDIKRCVF